MAKSTTTTAARAPAKRSRSAAAVAAKPTPEPAVVQETLPAVSAPGMKKKELIDRVAERSGVKKKMAKPVVEAMMAVMGEALGEGRELSLQPLGRIKVSRIKAVNNGKVMIARIRQSESAVEELESAGETAVEAREEPAKDTLADPKE